MSINKDEIIKMANLSRLKLKEDEIEYFASQMNSILEFVNKLNEVNIENIEQEYTPTFLREDEKR
ncbi:MAG: Asp-tRNA(Asn)/Glu-tRNA(Gln) amidotransferase subunit GatC, partial [Candidatus Jordarchaeales archaeon]